MLSLIAAALLGADSQLTVEPSCRLDGPFLTVHVAMTSTPRAAGGGTLYSFTCDTKARNCAGTMVGLSPRPDPTRLRHGDLIPMRNLELASLAGRVAVVKWLTQQFVVDLDAATVTLSSSGANGPERAVGRCK